ncbi:hypothetical protein CRUP_012448, partial [Coryphaenoides rupestris]
MATRASTVKRLTRKRQRTSFNVSAFEKHLEPDYGAERQAEESGYELSSLSTSLGLKTPAVDVSTGKGGLRRKAQKRTKFSVEDFSAAVQQRQVAGGQAEDEDKAHPALHGTSSAECFTLGVSDLSDLTTDVTHHSTAMCAGASGLPIVDTCQPQEGGEQGADTVKEHPAAEDHPSTEDHPSAREDEPTARSTTEAALVAMETEEENSVETNVEEEEQGEPDCAGLPGVQRSRTHSDGHLLRKRPSEDPNKMAEDAVALPPMNLICEASFSDQVAVGEAQGEEENKEEE